MDEKTPPRKGENGSKHEGEAASEDESSPAAASASTVAVSKCSACNKRFARKGCTEGACLACCKDPDCASHKEARDREMYKEQVLAGTTRVQQLAKWKRSRAMDPTRCRREPGFAYTGDTVVLWDIQQYWAQPKWRDDAVRKSKKRRARLVNEQFTNTSIKAGQQQQLTTIAGENSNSNDNPRPVKKSRRQQRFQTVMDQLYQKSLAAAAGSS